MDITTLCHALAACSSPVEAERKGAEHALEQHATAPGQLVNLLRVAGEAQVDPFVRQQASIYLKNVIRRSWCPTEGKASPLDPHEKQVVKQNFLETLVRASHEVQAQLVEAFKDIIHTDFPQDWPGLVEGLYANLTSQEPERVYGGLLATRGLCRKYNFVTNAEDESATAEEKEEAAVRIRLAEVALPVLLTLFEGALADAENRLHSAEVLSLSAKCLGYLVRLDIPPVLAQPQQFAGWMQALHTSIIRPVPTAGQPTDPDLQRKWPWWRARKRCMMLAYAFFSRFSNAKDPAVSAAHKTFGQMYRSQCMSQFLDDHIQMLVAVAQGHKLPDPVLSLLLQYLTRAISIGDAYSVLKPHMDGMLLNVIFPLLCHNDVDEELFHEDPQEFIRRGYDIGEAYNVKSAAAELVSEAVKLRSKGHLKPFMTAMAGTIADFSAERASGNVSVASARRMDGALLAIGYISAALKTKAPYKNQLEAMLTQCVLPCLGLPMGHLRAKAAWLLGLFVDIEFHNPAADAGDENAKAPTFYTFFHALVGALRDPDLPVRVDAAVSLNNYIDEMELGDTALLQILPQLLEAIVRLMTEVDNEGLLMTMERTIETAGDDIAPYALNLTRSLVDAFAVYSAKDDEDADDYQAAMAAAGCLNTINTLLSGLSDLPHMFAPMEELLFPLIHSQLSECGSGVEEVLETVLYITYLAPTISPRMWSLWPLMHSMIVDQSVQHWDEVLGCFDNYIGNGTEHFLTCKSPDYLASVYEMSAYTMNLDCGYDCKISALQLLSVVLQNCKGRVDACVGPYVTLALAALQEPNCTRELMDEALVLLGNALYYNAALTVPVLAAAGKLQTVFGNWYSMIFATRSPKNPKPRHFRTLQQKKVIVLGLSSLLAVPDDSLPQELRAGLSQIVTGILKLLLLSKDQEEEEEKEEQEDAEEAEEADGDEGAADDQDVEEDPEYLKNLTESLKQFRRRQQQGTEEEEDDDSDDDEWAAYSGHIEQHTPLDDIDTFVFFAEALTHVRDTNPARYMQLLGNVDAGTRQAVEGMMAYAQERAAKAAAAAAEEAAKALQGQ